ncbi:endonuclease 8-like 1 [Chanos chanos]|uniref:Endonuclease 8-like 1 n=1 Tax=Chanos chanos TaxID=29144 RepID=A0A6J2UPA9_CHACN|nr:endonuclease 8-like 1 [Chanos chanos]
MPEGPELHLASLFVNRVCEGLVFSGCVEKSEVSKSPAVDFACDEYRITATSRGKEVRLTLTPIKNDDSKGKVKGVQNQEPMDVVLRFGMSGFFRFTNEDELPKHAHLRFYTNEKPRRVLSFVDARRFGSWQPNGTWQADRGPCIMFEYEDFRQNVLSNLSDKAFDRPICEALLNQKYFNGIGNYLRAEILYRLKIPPFVKARTVLEGLVPIENKKAIKEEVKPPETSHKGGVKNLKAESQDLLSLCHTVPLEVVKLGGKGYDPEKTDYSVFEAWLQCYYVDGMNSLRDHNGRTMWFKGEAGPMAPKDSKSPKAKRRIKKDDHDYTDTKKGAKKSRTDSLSKDKPVKPKTGTKRPTVPKRQKNSPEVEQTDDGKRKTRRKSSSAAPQKQNRSTKKIKAKTGQDVSTPKAKKKPNARRKSSTAEPQRKSGRIIAGSLRRNS